MAHFCYISEIDDDEHDNDAGDIKKCFFYYTPM